MRRSFFFCCCLMFHVVVCYAQTELSGKVVTREDRQGLEWASVVAENNQHKPVAFTKTGKGGLFVINIPSGKSVSFLSVSMLGYEKITVSTDSFQNGSVITIGEQPFELKEVKAVSKRIKQQSDTLIYSVAGFRQKQDRSIADVISKMPGLEVADNGAIKYLGRPIENLYIEGMDLMGGNYTMASENLNAAKVKEVQVLTHHQQVQALRNVQFSDQTSLNLVLEEDARNTWIGLLEIRILYVVSMIIHHIEDNADACLMERLYHLLELANTTHGVIWIGAVGTFGHIIVHRVIAPIVFIVLQPHFVHRTEVITGQDMNGIHTQVLQMLYRL